MKQRAMFCAVVAVFGIVINPAVTFKSPHESPLMKPSRWAEMDELAKDIDTTPVTYRFEPDDRLVMGLAEMSSNWWHSSMIGEGLYTNAIACVRELVRQGRVEPVEQWLDDILRPYPTTDRDLVEKRTVAQKDLVRCALMPPSTNAWLTLARFHGALRRLELHPETYHSRLNVIFGDPETEERIRSEHLKKEQLASYQGAVHKTEQEIQLKFYLLGLNRRHGYLKNEIDDREWKGIVARISELALFAPKEMWEMQLLQGEAHSSESTKKEDALPSEIEVDVDI